MIRKLQELGLKTRYETDQEFNIKVKSLPALAFVPPEDVCDRYDELAVTFPTDVPCRVLLSYFENTYVRGPLNRNGRRREPRFPPRKWNQFEHGMFMEPKTTNCCEGFHNGITHLYLCAHPNMWTFLKGLQKDISYYRLSSTNDNVQQNATPVNKYSRIMIRLAEKVQNYENEEDKLRYLRGVAHIQVAN